MFFITIVIIPAIFALINFITQRFINTDTPSKELPYIDSFAKAFLLNLAISSVYVVMVIHNIFGSGSGDETLILADIFALLHGLYAFFAGSIHVKKNNKSAGYGYILFGFLILIPSIFGGLLLLYASRITYLQ